MGYDGSSMAVSYGGLVAVHDYFNNYNTRKRYIVLCLLSNFPTKRNTQEIKVHGYIMINNTLCHPSMVVTGGRWPETAVSGGSKVAGGSLVD